MRPAWWGRLEVRFIAALVALGIVCVGASAYLVRLTVAYFDDRVADALEQANVVTEQVEPFHTAVVDAEIAAFEARADNLAYRLDADAGSTTPLKARLQAALQREDDIVRLATVQPGGTEVRAVRPDAADLDALAIYEVEVDPAAHGGRRLQVAFRIDPAIDARYQELGRLKRSIGVEQDSREDIERAVTQVLGLASALVLLVAIGIGFWVARSMTRKVTELSTVMLAVGQGDLSVRATRRGQDELSQLAAAFNGMLDELAAAQQKVAYLQRIGAWQGMARRIAHEIKNPLTPIQLAVQQVRDKDPKTSPAFSAMLRTSVEIVEDEIEGLRRMVASFSQFAKVPEVRLAPTTVARVLEEFQRAYGHLTEDEDEALELTMPDEEIELSADRQLLKQALVNLVENAVLSAREAGRTPVRVSVAATLQGSAVHVTVDDNGPGIEEQRRDDVFEPYQTSRKAGTGLGLAIVKKIVLDHGGEIWIEDSPLGGARFVITLPSAAS
ncbi:MAG: ATP-binding protein [Myxococcota bacterium]